MQERLRAELQRIYPGNESASFANMKFASASPGSKRYIGTTVGAQG